MIRVLLIGCGDVALRTAAPAAIPSVRLYGLTRRVDDVAKLRAHGIVPIIGDLDRLDDASTACARRRSPCCTSRRRRPTAATIRARSKLIATLARARSIPQRFVYISTSGVYGDCAGARVAETRPRRAQTPRARRRVAAEDRLRDWARRYGVALSILRAPGIYAETRLPLDRIRQGTPVLAPEDDVYTNHIHADDLARATVAALFRAQAQPRLQRHRRRRDEDGRLVRRGRRCVPAAASAARVVGGSRAAHRAACCCRS